MKFFLILNTLIDKIFLLVIVFLINASLTEKFLINFLCSKNFLSNLFNFSHCLFYNLLIIIIIGNSITNVTFFSYQIILWIWILNQLLFYYLIVCNIFKNFRLNQRFLRMIVNIVIIRQKCKVKDIQCFTVIIILVILDNFDGKKTKNDVSNCLIYLFHTLL